VTFDCEMFKKVAIAARATTSTDVSFRGVVKEIATSALTKEKRSGVAVVVVIVPVVTVPVVIVPVVTVPVVTVSVLLDAVRLEAVVE